MDEQQVIQEALHLENTQELPEDFQVTDTQWRFLTAEIPEIVRLAMEINSEIKDTIKFRERVQKGLLLRLYQIHQAAQHAIEEQNLHEISVYELKFTKKGGFIVMTKSGSVHYLESMGWCSNYMRCFVYDRQSYYKYHLSESVKSNLKKNVPENVLLKEQSAEDNLLPETLIQGLQSASPADPEPIRVKISQDFRLKVSKREEKNGQAVYESKFTSTVIDKIYTSEKVEDTSRSYMTLTTSITNINRSFIEDITRS